MPKPKNVGGFGADGLVPATQDIAETFDGEGWIHNDNKEFDGRGGTKAAQTTKFNKLNA
jgi:hypothetical protein